VGHHFDTATRLLDFNISFFFVSFKKILRHAHIRTGTKFRMGAQHQFFFDRKLLNPDFAMSEMAMQIVLMRRDHRISKPDAMRHSIH
jgi:hypothetical protein